MKRKETRAVTIGNVTIGSNMPVRVQSMCNTFTFDVDNTITQVFGLEDAGCEIVQKGKVVSVDALMEEVKKV